MPSHVKDEATTFDLMVYDVLMAWDRYKQDQANGKLNPAEVSEDRLLEILKQAKG